MIALVQPLFKVGLSQITRGIQSQFHRVNNVDCFVNECLKNVKCFIWVNFMTFRSSFILKLLRVINIDVYIILN